MSDLEAVIQQSQPDVTEDQLVEASEKALAAAREILRLTGDQLLQVRLKPAAWKRINEGLAIVMVRAALGNTTELLKTLQASDFQ
jgi:hypothetical protein